MRKAQDSCFSDEEVYEDRPFQWIDFRKQLDIIISQFSVKLDGPRIKGHCDDIR